MRLTRRVLAMAATVAVLAVSAGSAAAVSGVGAGVLPAADDPPVPTDQALVASASSSPVTLARGGSTVTVSRTADLTRQMLTISWQGMTASNGNNNPVMVMQCRGTKPSREDCWMGNVDVAGNALGNAVVGAVRPSLYEPTETSSWWSSPPGPSPQLLRIPFRKADGSYLAYPNESGNGTWTTLPLGFVPDGASPVTPIDDVTPSTRNFRRGLTGADGTGQTQTWVNTGAENPSLGCSDRSPCSLVVVPVRDLPCKKLTGVADTLCKNAVGKSVDANWQLLGNWYERYVFELSFAPAAAACDQRDDSAVLLGSELVAEAMRRWVPARCPKSSPAGLDFIRGWEPDSRRQLGQYDPVSPSGYAADGAVVSEPAAADEPVSTRRRAAYAPIGVSGFAIGFTIDNTQGGPVPEIKLNQRLVAKLLTQSYAGRYVAGTGLPVNPNVPTNPQNLMVDPEFELLNPGSQSWAGRSAGDGTQLAMPVFKTDVFLALTRWIWADPTARAFLQGRADQWGMTVNRTYRGWQVPRDDYELNDGWQVPDDKTKPAGEWIGFSPQALWAQSANSWSNGADTLMTAWPLSQVPVPNLSVPTAPIQPKRVEPQLSGFRSVLAVSTTSELAKTGMRAASLRNAAGEFVAPGVESMTYALDGATADRSTGVYRLNYDKMDRRGYPGTMVSYAAVPTATLKPDTARQYAETIRWASTEGQIYGQESGQLPDGYLALTEPMRAQAARVADAVENQTGTPPVPPAGEDPLPGPKDPSTDTPQNDAPGNNQGGGNGPDDSPGPDQGGGNQDNAGNPQATPSGAPTTPPPAGGQGPTQNNAAVKPVSSPTQGESLGWLAWGIPALLVAGLAAGVASPGIRLIAQPGHPIRRRLSAGGSYLAALARRGRRRG